MNGVMDEPRDDELWRRATAGDADAFGALFERHARTVYNFCFRRTADWAAAEDLTSAVFLESWRRRHTVEIREGNALPWLLGVATNLLRNRRRSLRRHADALRRFPVPRDESDLAADVAGRIDDARSMRGVLALVGRLPSREQEVLALCAWTGLSYEEAAVALRLPVGTVRSRLSRARRRLAALAAADPPTHLHANEGAVRP